MLVNVHCQEPAGHDRHAGRDDDGAGEDTADNDSKL